MKDRIKQYIDSKGITAGELAVMLDVQRSNISHILNGRNKPGAALIEKLLLVFPDLNARWLLTGKGNMSEESVEKTEELSATLPFTAENESIEQKKDVVEPEPNSRTERIENRIDGNVDKMILLYSDGTFSTYRNRDKK